VPGIEEETLSNEPMLIDRLGLVEPRSAAIFFYNPIAQDVSLLQKTLPLPTVGFPAFESSE
jgi:hypothetical protein